MSIIRIRNGGSIASLIQITVVNPEVRMDHGMMIGDVCNVLMR